MDRPVRVVEPNNTMIRSDFQMEVHDVLIAQFVQGHELLLRGSTAQDELRWHGTTWLWPEECGGDLNRADNMLVELRELIGWDPQLLVLTTADDAFFESRGVRGLNRKSGHVPDAGVVLRVPLACDGRGIAEVRDGIEDRLFG